MLRSGSGGAFWLMVVERSRSPLLRRTAADCRQQLVHPPDGAPCRLVEELVGQPSVLLSDESRQQPCPILEGQALVIVPHDAALQGTLEVGHVLLRLGQQDGSLVRHPLPYPALVGRLLPCGHIVIPLQVLVIPDFPYHKSVSYLFPEYTHTHSQRQGQTNRAQSVIMLA